MASIVLTPRAMKLKVLSSAVHQSPWYSQGLGFTCTQCGNCCTGPPGFVWISEAEIVRLAEYLKLTPQEVVERYCRKLAGKFSLKESKNPRHGGYDCIFLKEQSTNPDHPRRTCEIYPVRPLQCRTWPFWPSNLKTPQAWAQAGRRCPGMDHGKLYDQQQIQSIRDRQEG
jgi:hypothetical protein